MNIAINGFGRIGRLGFRAGWDHPAHTISVINELHGTAETGAHLLEFDTVHGRWDRQIESRPIKHYRRRPTGRV